MKEKVINILKDMAQRCQNEEEKWALTSAAMFLDGKKHKAVWQDKVYHCPICGRELNPSYQRECPDCKIKIEYKKSGKKELA